MALFIYNHSLINHYISIIKNKETKTGDFNRAVDLIAQLMAYEITKNLPTKKVEIETPLTKTMVDKIDATVVLVPILRAGLGMLKGFQNIIPDAKAGFVGLSRNEKTLKPEQYYLKLPKNLETAKVILTDPMLATGGSAVAAIDLLKKAGAKDIVFAAMVGVDEGIKKVQEHHPDVDIYLACKDEKLNERGYIEPGLGDCGDRLFGTDE